MTGIWNTVFGVLAYAILYELLKNKVHYLLLVIPSNILAVTNAYICYKVFVFETKGNILKEYVRCYAVYGASMIIGAILLFIFVDIFGFNPIVAQCLGLLITTVFSYVSHRNFSFNVSKQ
ncbi:MAG: GtrA family protein [Candidatus Nanoarchaeia archaeon]